MKMCRCQCIYYRTKMFQDILVQKIKHHIPTYLLEIYFFNFNKFLKALKNDWKNINWRGRIGRPHPSLVYIIMYTLLHNSYQKRIYVHNDWDSNDRVARVAKRWISFITPISVHTFIRQTWAGGCGYNFTWFEWELFPSIVLHKIMLQVGIINTTGAIVITPECNETNGTTRATAAV